MASQIRATRRTWSAAPLEPRAAPATRLPPIVAVARRERGIWAALEDIAYAVPGTIIVGLDGTTLRIREDGSAEEVKT